jgi:hypothetical protein
MVSACVVLGSLVSGCDDPQKQQPAPQPEVNNVQQDTSSQSVIAPEVKSKELLELTLKKIEPLPGKELLPYLPTNLGNTVSSSTARVNKQGYNWSKTLGEYVLSDGTSITVGITDYGGSAILAARTYEIPSTEVGVSLEKLSLPNGFGYKVYNDATKNGILAVLIAKRFGIEIEGKNMTEKNGDLSRVLDKVNIEGLIKKAK